jgi:hypothetical protein
MTGPVDTNQDEPLDPAAYRHQLLLLKSMHCTRPVLHQGRKQFIKCMTANVSGCDIGMTVYLAGIRGGIDSSEIQINTAIQAPSEDATHG